MPNSVVLRVAIVQDLPAILALVEVGDGAPEWPASAWESFVAADRKEEPRRLLLLGTTAEGILLGLLAATVLLEETELELVFVGAAWRQQGLGGTLARAWLEWASVKGARRATLEVRASNAPAIALYRMMGFNMEGRRRHYYRGPVEDAVLMGRLLERFQPAADEAACEAKV